MFGLYVVSPEAEEVFDELSDTLFGPDDGHLGSIDLSNRYLDKDARSYLEFASVPTFIESSLRNYEKIIVLQSLLKLGHRQAVCDYLSAQLLTYKNEINLDAYCHFYENFNILDYCRISEAAEIADISASSLKKSLVKSGLLFDGLYHDFSVTPELYATFSVFFMPLSSGLTQKLKPTIFIHRKLLTKVIYDYHAVALNFSL